MRNLVNNSVVFYAFHTICKILLITEMTNFAFISHVKHNDYQTIMSIYRKTLVIVSSSLFRFLIFFSVGLISLMLMFTDRGYIPKVLKRNNVYNKIVDSILATNKDQSLSGGSDIKLNDPEIQRVIKASFSSQDLEEYTTHIIGSTYDWLEGNQTKLSFSIDLTKNKRNLSEGLSNYLISRLQSLPACDTAILQVDPLTATCKPYYINYETIRADVYKEIYNNSGFLDNPVIDQSIIIGKKDSASSKNNLLPWYYSILKKLPIVVPISLILLAISTIYASSTKKKGFLRIGRGLVGAGSSLIFFTVIFTFVIPMFTGSIPLLQTSGQGIDALLSELSVDFGRDYSVYIIKLCLPLIVFGAFLILYSRTIKDSKNYRTAKLKSGIVSGNEEKKKSLRERKIPPIQSSELSKSKPKNKRKNKKYRKIPNKEL